MKTLSLRVSGLLPTANVLNRAAETDTFGQRASKNRTTIPESFITLKSSGCVWCVCVLLVFVSNISVFSAFALLLRVVESETVPGKEVLTQQNEGEYSSKYPLRQSGKTCGVTTRAPIVVAGRLTRCCEPSERIAAVSTPAQLNGAVGTATRSLRVLLLFIHVS